MTYEKITQNSIVNVHINYGKSTQNSKSYDIANVHINYDHFVMNVSLVKWSCKYQQHNTKPIRWIHIHDTTLFGYKEKKRKNIPPGKHLQPWVAKDFSKKI